MQKKKIRIILQSFNHAVLKDSCQKILNLCATEKPIKNVSGPISLPTTKRSYCVLRSPHVNKDSREQFEIRRYKKIIEIYSNSRELVSTLLNLDISAGVSTELFGYK